MEDNRLETLKLTTVYLHRELEKEKALKIKYKRAFERSNKNKKRNRC